VSLTTVLPRSSDRCVQPLMSVESDLPLFNHIKISPTGQDSDVSMSWACGTGDAAEHPQGRPPL
jgi:hypothetical protein